MSNQDLRTLSELLVDEAASGPAEPERLPDAVGLLEISHDALFALSATGRIQFWNPAAEELFGWTKAEVLGTQSHDSVFGRVSKEFLEAQAAVMTDGGWTGELTLARADGKVVHTLSRLRLTRDDDGKPQSILIACSDRSNQTEWEQQSLRSQRLQCIGSLASGIAHDLNNVFSPILMVAECLADRFTEKGDTELVELVRNSAERGAWVIRQLLAFGRHHPTERVELQLDQLVKETSRLARETFPSNISFSTHTAPHLWAVSGDIVQINQVLLNLSLGARDAMPNGGRLTLAASNVIADDVFCRMIPEARPGPHVVIEVSDAGNGMSDKDVGSLLDPKNPTRADPPDCGLGIPTVAKIVRAHQGFIEIQSRPKEGTRVRVYLPATCPAETGTDTHSEPPPPPAQGERILILDDEQAVCDGLKRVLLLHHYIPVTVLDALEALHIFANDPGTFHAIITDMMMPGIQGLEFIRAVREISPDIPLLVMSGSLGHSEEVRLAARGDVSFLEKPFNARTLLWKLHDAQRDRPAPPPT